MTEPPVWLTEAEARQKGALGREPVPDARYLLAPIIVPAPPDIYKNYHLLEGFNNFSRLSALFIPPNGQAAFRREDAEFAWAVWGAWEVKKEIGSPAILMKVENSLPETADDWADLAYDQKAFGFRLDWKLNSVLTGSITETARELAQYVNEATRRVAPRGWMLSLNQTVEEAALHAEQLVGIKTRFSQSVEMRLVPRNRPFFSQDVWKAAYAIGMQWTDWHYDNRIAAPSRYDRFVWPYRNKGNTLFFVSAGETYGVLTLESAARNETIPGLTFWYELPIAPAPIETFDRMTLALNYFAHTLNGRPMTASGRELDADALESLRDELEATVQEMARLGLAPGSPEAVRFF